VLTVVLTEPTKLSEAFGCELVARTAQVVWKNGGLRMTTWGTPTTATAIHSLTEADKAAPRDAVDKNRTAGNDTTEHLVNLMILNYDRILSDGYRSHLNLIDRGSGDDFGEKKVEIDLSSRFLSQGGTGSRGVSGQDGPITELAARLEQTMGYFTRPLRVLRRTIARPFFEDVAPGDYCTISDNFARDPATGRRGMSNKPGLIIRHFVDWGGFEPGARTVRPMTGEVDILILPIDGVAPYAPCAEVDHAAAGGGYNAGTKVLTCEAHAHSNTGETHDAARFAVGAKVLVIEVDPDNPAAPQSWNDTVAAQSGDTMTMTTGLALFDSAKRYRVVSRDYANATGAQQANVYQADDADARVEDTIDAYLYAAPGTNTYVTPSSPDTGAEPVALYAQAAYGDGVPLDTGYERDVARLVNNLQATGPRR
jgi:hypothetical protein